MATARSNELRALARGLADAFPVDVVEEVVLTGSVSRGTADEVSDIEMLVVTREPFELEDCFELATAPTLLTSSSAPAATGLTPLSAAPQSLCVAVDSNSAGAALRRQIPKSPSPPQGVPDHLVTANAVRIRGSRMPVSGRSALRRPLPSAAARRPTRK